jgi:hypothetical protein
LGALKAFENRNQLENVAIISQSSIPEAREELRKANSRMIASVAYFPERYGDHGSPVPTASRCHFDDRLASEKTNPSPLGFVFSVFVSH